MTLGSINNTIINATEPVHNDLIERAPYAVLFLFGGLLVGGMVLIT